MAGRASIIDDYDEIKKAKEDLFPDTASNHTDTTKALPYKELVSVYLDAEFKVVRVGGLTAFEAKEGIFLTRRGEMWKYMDSAWKRVIYKENK